jgi:hypothetical protein
MENEIIVVNKTNLNIVANYYSDEINLTKPGPDFDQSTLIHIRVPVEFKNTLIKCVLVDGQYTIQPDTDKIAAEAPAQWTSFRIVRNQLLASSDWTRLDDVQCDKEAWAVYRQALRDLPANTTDPTNVTWPTPPS